MKAACRVDFALYSIEHMVSPCRIDVHTLDKMFRCDTETQIRVLDKMQLQMMETRQQHDGL